MQTDGGVLHAVLIRHAQRFSRIEGGVRDHGALRVLDHDRTVSAFLSLGDFENGESLKVEEREIKTAGDIPDDFLPALDEAVANGDA